MSDSWACCWPPTLTVSSAEHFSSSTSAVPAKTASTALPSSVEPVQVPVTAPSVAMVDVQSRLPSMVDDALGGGAQGIADVLLAEAAALRIGARRGRDGDDDGERERGGGSGSWCSWDHRPRGP